MITLAEGADRWLGDDSERAPRRAMLFGAGFTKSAMSDAPLFWDAAEAVRGQVLRKHQAKLSPDLKQIFERTTASSEVSDIIELSDLLLRDRSELVPALLAEPSISGMRLGHPAPGPLAADSPVRGERAYRLLRGWRQLLTTSCPTHLEAIGPGSPPLIVGRMVLEGVIDELLSTNWDALIEVGCMLVGVRVRDVADHGRDMDEPAWLRALPVTLMVFEAGEEATRHPRMRGEVSLRKLHGGVKGIDDALRLGDGSQCGAPAVDKVLRQKFLVTSSELVRWDGAARWVEDAVGDTLRTHATLLVGVSGGDPVVYHAFRKRICEWEIAGDCKKPLPIVALNRSASLRLRSLVGHQNGAQLEQPVVEGDAGAALRGVFAGWLGSHFARALAAPLAKRLHDRLKEDLNKGGPLVDILVHAIHPNARWAAIAEGRAPFSGPTPSAPFRRWWLAPWGLERGQADAEHLKIIAAFCLALRNGWDKDDSVDPWTGVVHLRAEHPVARCLAEKDAVRPGPLALLPLPWPWQAACGALSPRLSSALRLEMDWAAGCSLPALARAPLWLVPLPHQQIPSHIMQPVAGARARWLPGDEATLNKLWLELADHD